MFDKIRAALAPRPTLAEVLFKSAFSLLAGIGAGATIAAVVKKIKTPAAFDGQAGIAASLMKETEFIEKYTREGEFKKLVIGITNNDAESLRAYAKVLDKRARAANPPDAIDQLQALRGLVDALETSGAIKGVKIRVSDDGRVRFDKTATS
jgi:hypothetical protein